ncbi:MAG: protein O-GlcNAc transferase [Gammaproteobacteria bacterium]
MIKQHDRDRFEVFCYYNSQTWDKSTHRIHDAADHWQDIIGWSDERLAGVIANDKIDILVDLSGHTAHHRLSLFGSRAAPLQVSMIGYPHSTGLTNMDYLIADNWVCPKEQDHLCSEQVERLPICIFNYLPEDIYGPVNIKAAEQRKQIVFGSFNNIPKVTPSTIKLWAKVLKAVPGSVFKLKAPSFLDAGCRERYLSLFENEGIERRRLQVVGPTELSDMMREYGDIDIALDPIPYNGGTTTVQALWMGVPVVTLEGRNFCGRMGVSILTNVGLNELIAETDDQYVAIAKSLAEDKQRRLSMRSALREQMIASPLCDNETYTRELEKIYQRIWDRHCDSALSQ